MYMNTQIIINLLQNISPLKRDCSRFATMTAGRRLDLGEVS